MLSQRNDRKASVARRSLRSLPASFVKGRKELITDHLWRNHRSGRPLHGRIAQEAPTAEPPGLQAQACSVLCAHCARPPEGQSPDLTSSTHREVQLTRSAALARAAGKRLRRAAGPTDLPGRAASAAGHVWHGRVRARSTWLGGRHERREREGKRVKASSDDFETTK